MSIHNGYILPTEILQLILSFLDLETFYFASRTCRLWRDAALTTSILRHQLLNVPSLRNGCQSRLRIQNATAEELQFLFNRTCRKNLIGLRTDTEINHKSSSTPAGDNLLLVRSKNESGPCVAQLTGNTISLSLSTPSTQPTCKPQTREIQLDPTIYPSPETVQQLLSQGNANVNAFFRSRSVARMQLALSQCGDLLAVGLGQKIHVYCIQRASATLTRSMCKEHDHENGLESEFAQVLISNSITDSIQSLEFDSKDELLRCEIDSAEGSYVRYLGFQKCRCFEDTHTRQSVSVSDSPATKLNYWRIALKRIHFDSRSIEEGLGGATSLRGTRLLPPRREKEKGGDRICTCRAETYFFSLLRRGNCERFYAVGCICHDGSVRLVQEIPTRPIAAFGGYRHLGQDYKPFPVPIEAQFQAQAQIQAQAQARDHGSGGYSLQRDRDRFDPVKLPQANVHDPLLGVSEDGSLLVICEPPHGQDLGAVYICACERGSSDDGSETEITPAWPLILSTLNHGLDSVRVTRCTDTGGYLVEGQSSRQLAEWRLRYI